MKNKIDINKEKPKRKNNNINNKYYNNSFNTENNFNNIPPMNFTNFPLLYTTSFTQGNFPYMSFGLNNFQNFNYNVNNNEYNINNSLENSQESFSEDKNYYENFGENYYDSLQKGIKDISQIYNENKINRPKISLLCSYYCNINITQDDEDFVNNEIQKLGDSLKKIMNIDTNDINE